MSDKTEQSLVNQVSDSEMNLASLAEGSYRSKEELFEEGYQTGYSAAVNDYLNGKANPDVFEKDRNFRDTYLMGFEIGYLTKLAEIALF